MQVAGRLRRPFLLEYERRADAPAKMVEKLDPYRRYYAQFMRNEHWGATVVTLFVFEDAGAAGRFVVHCRRDSAAAQSEGRTEFADICDEPNEAAVRGRGRLGAG